MQNHKKQKTPPRSKLTREHFKTTAEYLLYRIRERCRADYGNSQLWVFGRETYTFRVTRERDGVWGIINQSEKPVGNFHITPGGEIKIDGAECGFAELAT